MAALDNGLAATLMRAAVEPFALVAWANDVDGPDLVGHMARSTDLSAIQWGRSGWARDQRMSERQAKLYRGGSWPRSVIQVLQDGRYADGTPLVPMLLLTSPWSPIAIGHFNGVRSKRESVVRGRWCESSRLQLPV